MSAYESFDSDTLDISLGTSLDSNVITGCQEEAWERSSGEAPPKDRGEGTGLFLASATLPKMRSKNSTGDEVRCVVHRP